MKYYFAEFKKKMKWYKKWYNMNIQRFIDEEIAKLPKTSKILDAGCGDGFVSKSYLDNYEVYGIDIEKEAVDYCTKAYPKGNYSLGDVYNLEFEDNFFDVIIFSQVIEHLYEPEKVLKELYRILKFGGIVLITTPNYDSKLWILIEHTYFRFFGGNCKPYKDDVHPSKYKSEMLKQHLRIYFEDVNIRKISSGTTLIAKVRK